MEKIITTKNLVKEILERYPETRNDDNLLWAKTIEETAYRREKPFNIHIVSLPFVLENIHRIGLPSFETVSRARRKLQVQFPELRGSEKRGKNGRNAKSYIVVLREMSPFKRLITAILRRAVFDYVKALRKKDLYKIQDIEKFFLSDYGQLLSMYNGEEIIIMAKRLAERKSKNEVSNRSTGNATKNNRN